LLNRTGVVTAIARLLDGTTDLRIQCSSSDDRRAVFYVSSLAVTKEPSEPVPAAPAAAAAEGPVGDVTSPLEPVTSPVAPVSVVMPVALHFGKVQWDKEQLAKLPKKPVPLKLSTVIEYGSLSYALLELSMRCTRSDISFLCPVTAAPLTVSGSLTASEQESLLATRLELQLDTCAVFYAVVGSNGHFVLLEAEPPQPGQSSWKLTYYDSLNPPSTQCMLSAQRLADKLMFDQLIPMPSNKRYQTDGWSCGLWCMQFLEESVRIRCGEKLQYVPMNFNHLITRTNKFIAMASKEINRVFPDADARLATSSYGVTAEEPKSATVATEPSSSSSATASTAKEPKAASTAVSMAERDAVAPQLDDSFTYDMAVEAAAVCTKCRLKGCSHCQKQWFLPRKLLRSDSCSSGASQRSRRSARSKKQ